MDSQFESMECNVCKEEFDERAHIARILKCGHSICSSCLNQILGGQRTCPTCRARISGNGSDIPRNYQLNDVVNLQRINKERTGKMEKDYAELASKFEKLASKAVGGSQKAIVTCCECQKTETEAEFHICQTCAMESYESDFVDSVDNKSGAALANKAICSTCAIRKHVNIGHKIVDYYKLLASQQYTTHAENVELIRKKYQDAMNVLDEQIETMKEAFEGGDEEIDNMLEMTRKGKSTIIQNKIAAKIGIKVEENTERAKRLTKIIQEVTETLQKSNLDLAHENVKSSETDCVTDDELD